MIFLKHSVLVPFLLAAGVGLTACGDAVKDSLSKVPIPPDTSKVDPDNPVIPPIVTDPGSDARQYSTSVLLFNGTGVSTSDWQSTEQIVKGQAAIQSFWTKAAEGAGAFKLITVDVKPLGSDAAREVGTFWLKTKDQPPQEVSGKYVVVWQRVGGEWKLATDIWNTTK